MRCIYHQNAMKLCPISYHTVPPNKSGYWASYSDHQRGFRGEILMRCEKREPQRGRFDANMAHTCDVP